MQRKQWVTGLMALALALAFPGLAAAQDDAFDDVTCPIPAVSGQNGWLANEIVDYLQTLGVEELGDDWTTLEDGTVTSQLIADIQADGATSYADILLVQAIISDAEQVNHADTCSCVLQSMQQMADDTTGATDALQQPHNNGDKTLTALVIFAPSDQTAAGVAVAADSAADFFTPSLSDASLYCSIGEVLAGDGDADNDGIDNDTEWDNTWADYTGAFGDGGEAGFKAVVDQYILNATAGANIIVGVNGPAELLIGTDEGTATYTANTSYPEEFVGTEDTAYTFASSDEAIITINATTGEATALLGGTATISATGNETDATGEKQVLARKNPNA